MHVTQRGVNRCATFLDDEDRDHYLRLLIRRSRELDVYVHAYVLMSNHIHLLLSAFKAGSISRFLRQVGSGYVAAFNRRHQRTGTLWEGRFKSCLVDTEDYLLSVYRYIELNPVRASMVDDPESYMWSSIHANLANRWDPLVTPHEAFLAIASDSTVRVSTYRAWLQAGVSCDDLQRVREHLQRERALGNPQFLAMAERTLGRSVALCRPGRPKPLGQGVED